MRSTDTKDHELGVAEETSGQTARVRWAAMAIVCFSGCGVAFLVGLLISFMASLGVLPVTRITAYLSVATLLSAFGLAFLGAHCLDRDRAIRKKNSEDAEQ